MIDNEELKKQIKILNQEIDSLNINNQLLKDEAMKQKLDFTRREAIVKQQIEYKEK